MYRLGSTGTRAVLIKHLVGFLSTTVVITFQSAVFQFWPKGMRRLPKIKLAKHHSPEFRHKKCCDSIWLGFLLTV